MFWDLSDQRPGHVLGSSGEHWGALGSSGEHFWVKFLNFRGFPLPQACGKPGMELVTPCLFLMKLYRAVITFLVFFGVLVFPRVPEMWGGVVVVGVVGGGNQLF